MADLAVIGAGSWGTALAMACARAGFDVGLWGRDPQQMQLMAQQRENQRYLPGLPFPDSLTIATDLAHLVQHSRTLLIVVPSHCFQDILQQIQPHLSVNARICWATKGLEPNTGRLLSDLVKQQFADQYPLAILSGPTFAKELGAGMPTAITLATEDDAFADDLMGFFHHDTLRVYRSHDMVGVQLGGAVKNVIAVGAGMADGLGFGANARTALITRGLAEMMRLGEALGGNKDTFVGMAGLGDLVLTCTDNQSRNRRFGLAVGQGSSIDDAEASISQVVEGRRNTKEVYLLAQRLQVPMPITEHIYRVLYDNMPPLEAAKRLLSREPKSED